MKKLVASYINIHIKSYKYTREAEAKAKFLYIFIACSPSNRQRERERERERAIRLIDYGEITVDVKVGPTLLSIILLVIYII
jgi:hypothetical protein